MSISGQNFISIARPRKILQVQILIKKVGILKRTKFRTGSRKSETSWENFRLISWNCLEGSWRHSSSLKLPFLKFQTNEWCSTVCVLGCYWTNSQLTRGFNLRQKEENSYLEITYFGWKSIGRFLKKSEKTFAKLSTKFGWHYEITKMGNNLS